MKRSVLWLLLFLTLATPALASHGVVVKSSSRDVADTVERLVSVLKNRGMTVFATIDHAAGARKVNEALKPTVLVIFGNPAAGTKLMQCNRTVGLDLPLKMLVYENGEGATRISYNHPDFLASRYNLAGCEPVLEKVGEALGSILEEVTAE